jgi:AcrR family transcriptional regulator
MDPRITRTRSSLQQSLLELVRERPLEDVTVGDIAEHAGVNRSSFYQHYSDKETLLADALDAAAEAAAVELPTLEDLPDGPPVALVAYLAHVDANAELYRRALGEQGSAVVMARVRNSIETVVRDAVAAAEVSGFDEVPVDVIAAGITGSALGVIRAWVERDPRPPVETAAAWLWRVLLGPGRAGR